jgi:hypothetical protein
MPGDPDGSGDEGRFRGLYLLVLGALVLEVLLFALVTRMYR